MSWQQQGPPSVWYEQPGDVGGPPRERATLREWIAARPAPRVPLVTTPLLWGGAAAMHEMGVTLDWIGAGTLATAGGAALYALWRDDRAQPDPDTGETPPMVMPGEVAIAAGACGGWLALAVHAAPWAPPAWWPTWILAGLGLTSWQWLSRHAAVEAMLGRAEDERTWARRKTEWHTVAATVKELAGTHLVKRQATLVGELLYVDTIGTGGYATDINTRRVCEGLGQFYGLPRGRIDCWPDDIPGKLWIAIRYRNPWRRPILHPLVSPKSIAAPYLQGHQTVRRPLVVGLDPEDGEPFGLPGGRAAPDGLPVWVPGQGGQVILFVGTKGAGKTNGLNVLTERLTAAADSRVLQINLTAPGDMRAWAPACLANALGRDQLGRARAILAWLEWWVDAYSDRSGEPYATPSPEFPHLTIIIDEVADVAKDPVCKARMQGIARKCRRAGVTLVFAGQRATAAWMGGADIRSLVDIVVLGRHTRPEDVDKAIGVNMDLPDLGDYGKGKHGVFMVVELVSGEYGRGRMLKLSRPDDCGRIARRRSWLADWTPPGMDDRREWLWEQIRSPERVGDDDHRAAYDDDPWWEELVYGADDDAQDAAHAEPAALRVVADLPDVPGVPSGLAGRIMDMIGRPEGASAGEVARATGRGPESARKYLTAFAAAGLARGEGEGRNRRYYAAHRPAFTVLDGERGDGE